MKARRRAFLGGLAATGAGWAARSVSVAGPARTRLILLGTGGGPRPRKNSNATSQVIVAGGGLYVVDCGDGVARQLVLAGLSLADLRHVFVTHHHSDHNADYGNLLLLGWTAGLRTQVNTWGPPPIERITRLFLEMSEYDIQTRITDEGRAPLAPLIRAHDLRGAGAVVHDAHVKVSAALVQHPQVSPAYAFRFDAPDRSIVCDTAPCDSLVALARGADVLVHEALHPAGAERLVARLPHAVRMKEHLAASHTTAADCGRIAAAAGVKTLVLSHFVPPDDPLLTDEMWREEAARHFRGRIVVGKDLMEI